MENNETYHKTLDERFAERDELYKGINILTNIVYSQVMMCDYTITIVDDMMANVGLHLQKEEKRNFGMLRDAAHMLKARLDRTLEPVLRLKNDEFGAIQYDSNQFMRFYLYLLDRTGGNLDDMDMEEIRLRRMPSQGYIDQHIIDRYKLKK